MDTGSAIMLFVVPILIVRLALFFLANGEEQEVVKKRECWLTLICSAVILLCCCCTDDTNQSVTQEQAYEEITARMFDTSIGNPDVIPAMLKAYKSGLDWGTIPALDEFKDRRVLKLYVDWFSPMKSLLNYGVPLSSTGEDAGYYTAQIERYTGQSEHSFPDWYHTNRDYIYWDQKTGPYTEGFSVDEEAKERKTPIAPLTREPLTESQIRNLRKEESLFEKLFLEACKKQETELHEYYDKIWRNREITTIIIGCVAGCLTFLIFLAVFYMRRVLKKRGSQR